MSGEATLKQESKGKVRSFLAVAFGIKNGCLMGFMSCKTAVFALTGKKSV